MKTNPLDQLRGICEQLLFRVADLHKSFKQFFIETMICYLSITGRVNFSQMARFGKSCESRFRQNFKRKFDWVAFNTGLASRTEGHLRAIAIDAFSIESGLSLSVEDVKLLLHNTVMVQRILSTFGKTPNLNLNQKINKELLFYGLKTAA